MKRWQRNEMDKEMSMDDGNKVMPDGTCKMKNGKSMKLNEGECCNEKGKVHKHSEHTGKS